MVLSSEKNLYEVLEIPSDASVAAIKIAYRKLARKYHPDLNNGNQFCVKKFKEVTEAYEILSNADKKRNYDILRGFNNRTAHSRFSEAEKAYGDSGKSTVKDKKDKYQTDTFSNVFNDILDGFKKTTSSSKPSSDAKNFKTKQLRPERGSDVYADVSISMLESIEGTKRIINILHTQSCPKCEGRPFLNGSKCPICGGLGEQSIHKKLTVKIPAGVKYGAKIRIANEGNKGYNGGKNGDVYLKIKIETSCKFKYDGLNVLCEIPITPFEAVLGASVEVSSPSGKILMKITPNTHSGQKFRLAGQGLVQDNKKGDMIVTVNIEVPKNPSHQELELYKKLRDAAKSDIRENK